MTASPTWPQLGKVLILGLACIAALTGAISYIESRDSLAIERAKEQSYPITDGIGLQILVSLQQETLKVLAENQKDLIVISQKLTTQMDMLMRLNNKNSKDD